MIPTYTGSADATGAANRMAAARHDRYLVAVMVFPPRLVCEPGRGYFVTTRTGNELRARNPLLSR
jgi:hypothetical protein